MASEKVSSLSSELLSPMRLPKGLLFMFGCPTRFRSPCTIVLASGFCWSLLNAWLNAFLYRSLFLQFSDCLFVAKKYLDNDCLFPLEIVQSFGSRSDSLVSV